MPSGYYRYPTIHSNTVVFVCEDDLWSVPATGGIARRLTSNLGEVTRPVLSPDGTQLAFVGREEGQSEVYCMPAIGGAARRLTFMGGTLCLTAGWTDSGKVIFANNAGHWYLRFTHLYSVDTGGNAPEQLNYGLARAIAVGPQGEVVIGRNTDDPARWKRYQGGTTGRLWIDRTGSGDFQSMIQLSGNLASPMWLKDRVYFISDHEGIGNIYSCLPNGEDLRRHTDHDNYYVRNASSDGQQIVYHAGAELFLYDPIGDQSALIPVEFHSSQTQRNRKFVSPARFLQDWTLHPKGHSVAITTRGKAFTFANWEGAVIQHGEDNQRATNTETLNGIRYRLPRWLNDGKRLIAVTDDGGEETLIIWNADGSGEPQRLNNLDIGRPNAIVVNPKKDQIAFSNHRYELLCLDLSSLELRLIDRGKSFLIGGFDWSPDGEWVAYSVSISMQVTVLKLWKAASGETFPLTRPVLRDVAPAFDPLGKYIYFLSYRTFDPVYDSLHFDLGFPRGMRPYLITLQKDLLSPFIPKPKVDEDESNKKKEELKDAGVPMPGGGEPETDGNEQTSGSQSSTEVAATGVSKEKGSLEEKPLQIDLEGIDTRVVAFSVPEGIYGRVLGGRDGKVFYTRFPIEGSLNYSIIETEPDAKGTLFIYNFEDLKEDVLLPNLTDFALSADSRTMICRVANRLRVFKAGEKPAEERDAPNRKTGWLDLNRVKVSVVPGAEWRQMFREAWRLQREQFWTPDMSQVDWLAVHDRYLPLVDRVSSRSEFSDLMWEMQGELGTSHAYEFGGDYRPEPNYLQGYLGAEFAYNPGSAEPGSESWQVTHIYRGDPWDQKADSPLAAPGVNIQVGDRIRAVNGRKLSSTVTPAVALINLAGEEVTLMVEAQGEETRRTVTVKTLRSETPVRYRAWVESNRQRVHQASNGRVGYVHIPDMGGMGYAEFHRGFLAEVDREGLIVDVRFNRGGHVSSLILEKLARRRVGYDTSRWGQIPYPYPPESLQGPLVALTNEYAGSDGDIFSHAFKLMQLGPLIGKRTWGGVIGISPNHALVDGTLTTQPEFSFWFNDVGWGVENYGTDPHIEVEITPQDYALGVDPQLEHGISEILALLESAAPPNLPDLTPKPSRALPKLPQR